MDDSWSPEQQQEEEVEVDGCKHLEDRTAVNNKYINTTIQDRGGEGEVMGKWEGGWREDMGGRRWKRGREDKGGRRWDWERGMSGGRWKK